MYGWKEKRFYPWIVIHELFVDSFGDDYKGQLRVVVAAEGLKSRLQLRDLKGSGLVQTAFTNAIPEDDDPVRQLVVHPLVRFQAFDEIELHKQGVNFITVLSATFSYESLFGSFSLVTCK